MPHDAVQGSTCKEQMTALDRMTFAEVLALAQSKGFTHKSQIGSAIVIPPRFFIINFPLSVAAHGLRWQLWGQKGNLSETHALMSKAVEENPQFKRHASVKELCGKLLDQFDM